MIAKTSIALLLSSSTASAAAANDDHNFALLSIHEYNSIKSTEVPNDFGGLPSSGDADQLWLDAATFEYEVATSHPPDIASSSRGYHPYLICSSSPNKSGQEREEEIQQIFQDTPDVSPTDYYSRGLNFLNNDTLSCGAYRTYNDTISKVYENNNDSAVVVDWMTVNPLHSSMKMAQYTVDTMMTWFIKGETSGDVVSIGGETGMDDTMQVKILGLHMILCPGVQNFGSGGNAGSDDVDVPDEDIANDIKAFVTENGGTTVKDLSFYHHRVEEDMDGTDAIHSERMAQWSNAVNTVTNWTNPNDGSNPCLDTVIRDGMDFIVNEQVLGVSAKLSFSEGDELAQSLGFQQEDVETCIWYMTYALAVNPMLCWVEPKTKVKTLCKDGSDDLSNCTSTGGTSPTPPAPTPPPTSSSSSNWIGTTCSSSFGIVASMALFIILGIANF